MVPEWLDTPQSYGRVSRGFHWLMATLFTWRFTGALLYISIGDTALTRFVGGSHFTLASPCSCMSCCAGPGAREPISTSITSGPPGPCRGGRA